MQLKKIPENVLNFLLPICDFYKKNKIIKNRINNIDSEIYENNFSYINDHKIYSLSEIMPYHERALERKKIIEDKAKLSAVAITISSSLVLGFSSLLLSGKYLNEIALSFKITIFVLFLIAIGHAMTSGILSLRLLGALNKVYQLFPEDEKLSERLKAEILAICTEQNTNLNIIRQNYLYSSYLHLIYSLVLIMFVLVALVASLELSERKEQITKVVVISFPEEFFLENEQKTKILNEILRSVNENSKSMKQLLEKLNMTITNLAK